MEVIMFIGIPGSGKSTFYFERFAATHLRINRDMLGTRHREHSLFRWCLDHEQSCVLDNTNTTRAIREPLLQAALEKGVKFKGYFFQSRIRECLERNRLRTGAAKLPDLAVRDHHARIELPTPTEGFTSLHFVRLTAEGILTEPWLHEI
ncbi:MAG: putative kinase [Akkermansiaceae bacterium]|nr:putative kinase [Akkermansiaceae bacterium]